MVDGCIGLGFAELRRAPGRSTVNAARPQMPASRDGKIWVVADADLDDRGRLAGELSAAGIHADSEAPAHDLILHAYRAWGAECLHRLHGDFSFALWDGPRHRLLLARDRFGVRPLYYARTRTGVVFSNALDVVRAHPEVATDLDPAAIGDFLRMGLNTDLRTTAFAAVRCVPPAHVLVVADDATVESRYWDLPTDGEIRHRRVEEYADHFCDVFESAVADRLRGADDVVLLLSGGRDSTAVAATARMIADRATRPRLHAVTAVYDYALPDEERTYAALAGAALRIPVEFLPQDEYGWFEDWERPDLWRPEPTEAPVLAAEAAMVARAATHARLGLTGDGGDAVLRESESRVARLLLSGHWWAAMAEIGTYMRWHHRMPRPGIRRLRQRNAGLLSPYPPVPPWMRTEFIRRAGLSERWEALERDDAAAWCRHSARPEAYTKTRAAFWPRCFEEDHASAAGIPLTLRHPFFDERVVEFLLALPPVQWLNDKGILVVAMRGRLPDAVVYRQKTPLVGDSYGVAFRAGGVGPPTMEMFDESARQFVDPDALFGVTANMQEVDRWDWVRAVSLSYWLRRLSKGRSLPAFQTPWHVEGRIQPAADP
ncbi:MAG: hypothetical protein B7Z74_02425 [Deltaproteobacteria bacterium 21-66-5]|nr:MAG: hypothetical protein B7Z74_02425 [Deltaproteobacteria bacterium 21-66-5]